MTRGDLIASLNPPVQELLHTICLFNSEYSLEAARPGPRIFLLAESTLDWILIQQEIGHLAVRKKLIHLFVEKCLLLAKVAAGK